MTIHEDHDHDRGLAFDLGTLSRRRALAVLGGGALAVLVGCGSDNDTTAAGTTATTAGSTSTTTGSATTTAATATGASCSVIPEETAGPYPGDGSNGPDVLTESGLVRRDIRSSFGTSTTTAAGVPLTINVDLVDTTNGCQPLAGAAVYLWHCDREGRYSLYSSGVENENYLRGVQESDAKGRVSYTSIFPACYLGRWPHTHFEVYESVDAATGGGTRYATSQIAIPEAAAREVYATAGYEQSVTNLSRVTLATDNVFGNDSGVSQLGTATGSVEDGYTITLTVPVDPTAVSSGATAPGSDGAPGGAPPSGGPGGTPPSRP